MKEFVEVIKLYLNRLKKKMIEDTGLDPKYTDSLKNLNVDIMNIHKEMDEMENISY